MVPGMIWSIRINAVAFYCHFRQTISIRRYPVVRFGRIGQAVRGLALLGAVAALALPLSSAAVLAHQSGPTGLRAAPKASSVRPIVFSSQAGGTGYRLYTVDPDGLNRTNLAPVNGLAPALDPHWSPDNSAIAFSAACPLGGRCLYMIKADGTRLTQLTFGVNQTDEQPTWSPDEHYLAFV